jgi:hypothetical protein
VNQVFEPTCFPIANDDPAAEAFEHARRNINRVVSRLRDKWSMVKMFNVGVTVESTTPTVVVQVNPQTEADWEGMVREMLSHIPEIEYHDGNEVMDKKMEIGVEFVTGKVVKPIEYPEREKDEEDEAEDPADSEECEVIRDNVDVIVDRLLELAGERKDWIIERMGEVERRKVE